MTPGGGSARPLRTPRQAAARPRTGRRSREHRPSRPHRLCARRPRGSGQLPSESPLRCRSRGRPAHHNARPRTVETHPTIRSQGGARSLDDEGAGTTRSGKPTPCPHRSFRPRSAAARPRPSRDPAHEWPWDTPLRPRRRTDRRPAPLRLPARHCARMPWCKIAALAPRCGTGAKRVPRAPECADFSDRMKARCCDFSPPVSLMVRRSSPSSKGFRLVSRSISRRSPASFDAARPATVADAGWPSSPIARRC